MQIGTQVIDHLVVTMTKKEMQQAQETHEELHLSTVITKMSTVKGLNIAKYDLKEVKGKICTIREVLILQLMTTVAKGIMNLMTYSKCVNVVVKPVMGYLYHIAMARPYGILKPGRGKIYVFLRNHSVKQISLLKQTLLWERLQQQTSFQLYWCQSHQGMSHIMMKPPLEKGNMAVKNELLDKIDLTGLGEWSQNEQKRHGNLEWNMLVYLL